jgi:NADH-quinone oxidoreductase subunit L
VGLVTALLTAFYMSRQVFMVFFGEERFTIEAGHGDVHDEPATAGEDDAGEEAEALSEPGTAEAPQALVLHDAPHESPPTMTLPLVVLAVLAAVGGVMQLPFTSDLHFLEHWLHPVIGENEAHIDVATGTKVGLAVIAVLAAAVGIAVAYAVYIRKVREPVEPEVLERGWYFDSSISAFVDRPGRAGFEGVAAFDRNVVDGAVNGVATAVRRSGGGLRTLQNGFVRSYALGIAGGAVLLLAYFLVQVGF